MARNAPVIQNVESTPDGGIQVEWEVDSFFADSEPPEKVLIDLNGLNFKTLDGDETSVEIPAATISAIGGQVLTISVIFWWSNTPSPDEQMDVVQVPIGGVVLTGGVNPAKKPVVTVVHVQPRTVNSASSIKIAWKSNNYNGGKITWGPENAPEAFSHAINPVGEVYEGTFTTNQPLSPSRRYFFKVAVRNTLHSPDWISTTIVVRSAADTISVRQFLITSGRPVTTPLSTVVGPTKSIRKLLLG